MIKRPGLGKGLSALIPAGEPGAEEKGRRLLELEISSIEPNPDQPRHHFDAEKLEELASSIRSCGLIQPIIVTRREHKYVLIAGERRWRAAQLAGFTHIPAVVRETEPGQMLTLALIENIQRQELNSIEEANAYRNLMERHEFTQESLASQLGKSRASITNTLRLLKLPQTVQDMVEDGSLSFGHARCLSALNHAAAQRWAETCVKKQLSVRELERQLLLAQNPKAGKSSNPPSIFVEKAAQAIGRCMGSRVTISGSERRGKVVIPYTSQEQLQRIFEALTQQTTLEE
jgi:ParB family chromosome partitioning protein